MDFEHPDSIDHWEPWQDEIIDEALRLAQTPELRSLVHVLDDSTDRDLLMKLDPTAPDMVSREQISSEEYDARLLQLQAGLEAEFQGSGYTYEIKDKVLYIHLAK